MLLVFLFAGQGLLDWFPSATYVPFSEDPYEHFRHMVLPSVALAAGQIAVYMRLLRTDMIATLQEDFIGVARAKGMPTRRILLRHALRPSSFSLLTVAAINVGQLIGGTIVIEQIFTINGLGSLIVAIDLHARLPRGPGRHRHRRRRLRARELPGRHPVRRARPEDPPCPSSQLTSRRHRRSLVSESAAEVSHAGAGRADPEREVKKLGLRLLAGRPAGWS